MAVDGSVTHRSALLPQLIKQCLGTACELRCFPLPSADFMSLELARARESEQGKGRHVFTSRAGLSWPGLSEQLALSMLTSRTHFSSWCALQPAGNPSMT